jgi:hypothetical protein
MRSPTMYNNPFIDGIVANQKLSEDHALGELARARKAAAGPRSLATAGVRFGVARWLTRSVFRAEPCSGHGERQPA